MLLDAEWVTEAFAADLLAVVFRASGGDVEEGADALQRVLGFGDRLFVGDMQGPLGRFAEECRHDGDVPGQDRIEVHCGLEVAIKEGIGVGSEYGGGCG